jgi:hypothetical protein
MQNKRAAMTSLFLRRVLSPAFGNVYRGFVQSLCFTKGPFNLHKGHINATNGLTPRPVSGPVNLTPIKLPRSCDCRKKFSRSILQIPFSLAAGAFNPSHRRSLLRYTVACGGNRPRESLPPCRLSTGDHLQGRPCREMSSVANYPTRDQL